MYWVFLKKDTPKRITKSIYMPAWQVERIRKIAYENETSFSNVVVSMLESCLNAGDTDDAGKSL